MIKDIALLSPIYITFFWSIVLFVQFGEKNKPKFGLGIFMVLAFFLYCSHAIFFSKEYYLYSYIEFIYIFSMLALHPLFYNYLLLLSDKWNLKKTLIRLTPAIFLGFLALLMTLMLNPEERVLYVKETLIDKNLKELNLNTLIGIKGVIFFISRMVFLIQVGFFGIKGVQLANKHNQQIEEYYSNTEGKTLNWVRLISIIIIVAATASIAFTFIGRSYFSHNEVSLLIPSVIFSIFLFIIGFIGNHQVQISTDFGVEEFEIDFNDVKIEKLKNQLVELFEINKIYKNSELRIPSVSEILNTNRTYVSKLINEEFQMNFNEFVNEYRVKEAKQLLDSKNNNQFTLEYIAEESGFGSLNSFTRVFKAKTGLTPGRFRDKKITEN